jgi:hypothetical protein
VNVCLKRYAKNLLLAMQLMYCFADLFLPLNNEEYRRSLLDCAAPDDNDEYTL